jgi:transposase
MERVDGRKASLNLKEERRRTVVRMKQNGFKAIEIQQATMLGLPSISRIWNAFQKEGTSAISGKPMGRVLGAGRNLTSLQEDTIRRKIIDKCPEQLKLDFALWTRDAVQQLIFQEFQIQMPIRTVGSYLHRWGFTPQKPVKFAYERRPEAVKKWIERDYKLIKILAMGENADIYWGDETSLRAGDVRGRGFAPKGKTPQVLATAKYENLSMVSAITNKGKISWMIVEGTINSDRFIEFLERLIKDASRKVFLILDNLRVHHSVKVKEWLEGHEGEISLYFLPPYSPDLNPDEHVNADLKYGIGSKSPVRTKSLLEENARIHMEILKANPQRIEKYFKNPAIAYAS